MIRFYSILLFNFAGTRYQNTRYQTVFLLVKYKYIKILKKLVFCFFLNLPWYECINGSIIWRSSRLYQVMMQHLEVIVYKTSILCKNSNFSAFQDVRDSQNREWLPCINNTVHYNVSECQCNFLTSLFITIPLFLARPSSPSSSVDSEKNNSKYKSILGEQVAGVSTKIICLRNPEFSAQFREKMWIFRREDILRLWKVDLGWRENPLFQVTRRVQALEETIVKISHSWAL